MAETPKAESSTQFQDFFRSILRSFVPAAYPEFASQQPSASALYLAAVVLVVLVLLAPVMYKSHQQFVADEQEARAQERAYFEEALPEELYFEDGQAHYDGEQPYEHVSMAGGQRHVLIVDTTGTTTKIPDEYERGMLITKDTVIYKIRRKGRIETPEEPVPATEGRVSARQVYVEAPDKIALPSFAIVLGAQFLYAAFPLFVVALLGAAVGYVTDILRKGNRLPFVAWFNVGTHAATPVAFTTASRVAAQTFGQFYLLVGVPLLLFVVLMTLGARACRQAQETREAT